MESKLTFRDLENFIESSIGDVQEQQINFKNKADALQQHYFTSTNSSEKDKLNALYYVNEQLEMEIENANKFIVEMEKRIQHLENTVIPSTEGNPLYSTRSQIYGLTEYMNAYLQNCKEEVDLINRNSMQFSKSRCQDTPAENIGRMMMKLLEALEGVELSLEKMKSHLHCINWKNKILAERLHYKRM
ncbi:hypothetical protein FQR65_LT07769 [Abscondita terminalis]|nr:hypothetical protein FQR65_LT07769 [Abscondita terminalis]